MRRREIFIELTGLLDVILIMLFVLLMQAKTQTDTALSNAADAEAALLSTQEELVSLEAERDAIAESRDRIADELGAWQREGITVGVVEENSLVVTLSVPGGERRSIRIEPRGAEAQIVPVVPEDENYTFNSLHTKLSQLIGDAGKETVFVVFQYDRSAIYQADYALVGRVVLQLKQEAKSADIALNYIETDITGE